MAAAGLFAGSYVFFRGEELARAEARLTLYRSTVDAELGRFAHLTYVLAQDPFVVQGLQQTDQTDLNARLSRFADRAGIDAIFLMDLSGRTLAASNAETDQSFVGQDYSFRPYFQTALSGGQGRFYGIGATTGVPGYFFADAVLEGGAPQGVIAIKIDLSALQESWQQAGERVILANGDGVALLSSVPEWRYRTLEVLDADQRARIDAARQFGSQPLEPLDWRPTDRRSARIGGQDLLYLSARGLPQGWTLHYFAPANQALLRSALVAVGFLLLAGGGVIGFQVQRARSMARALRQSVQEEVELRAANERLAIEIEDRRTAERRLRRTQAELERAGRLAALGQLAASVTHELGQPITAMRNHLTAAEMQTGSSAVTTSLQGLVDRMEGITRQLKFFSRKGRDDLAPLDLADALKAAQELVSPNVQAVAASLDVALPDQPVLVLANRLRIEQVMTNLLRNAVDAVADQDERQITVTIGQTANTGWFEVRDTGHGLGEHTLDELREPFTTTRESGHGMGLGLTISAGIIEDHDGTMEARNGSEAGAIFRVELPLVAAKESAA